jgi:hypothetical protein
MEYYMKKNQIYSSTTNDIQDQTIMYTMFDDCFVTEVQIPVPGCDLSLSRSMKRKDTGLFGSIQSVVAEYIIFCSLILFVLTWIFCCIRSCCRYLYRGGKVYPENFDDIENNNDI